MQRSPTPFPHSARTLLAAALIAVAGLAAASEAQTSVPVGGAVIPVNGGSQNIGIQVKNKTGKKAKDITVHVFHPDGTPVPNITGIDVTDTNVDKVDDDGNGELNGGNEGDTTDSSPGSTCSSIFDGNFDVANNGTIDVTVRFSGPTPEGTQIRVKFSEEKGGVHRDICMNAGLFPGDPFSDDWGGGRRLCGATVSNGGLPGDEAIGGFEMRLDGFDNGFEMLQLPEPFQIVDLQILPDQLFVQFQPPLLPGQCMDLFLGFGNDLAEGTGLGIIPLPAPPPCPGDFNGDGIVNTLDVLAFLNAWTGGC
ncbi:MAG: hypothetical protein ACF8R9_04135 [Phycisphaerales bacterium JB054]